MEKWKQAYEVVTIKLDRVKYFNSYIYKESKFRSFLIRLCKGQEYRKRRQEILNKKNSPLRRFLLRKMKL